MLIKVNVDELRRRIDSGKLSLEASSTTIEEGELKCSSGVTVEYTVTQGWNILSSKECDECWTQSNMELFEHIQGQNYTDEELQAVLNSLQKEDHHWDWFTKSCKFTGEEYRWFYLYANNKPQGACVIFQPKDSALDGSNIFYVEFLAVAPWNRDCDVRKREIFGVGSALLKATLKFSVESLKLTPGFSLHSLPQATKYYEKLNMVNIKGLDKSTLVYFELPKIEANKLLEVS